jgi:hypothetical protein
MGAKILQYDEEARKSILKGVNAEAGMYFLINLLVLRLLQKTALRWPRRLNSRIGLKTWAPRW